VNIRRFVVAAGVAAVMLGTPVAGASGDQLPGQGGIGQTSAVTLKVTVTISRWDAEKKVSSSPYVLMVVPSYGKRAEEGADGDSTIVQMGSETPVPSTTVTDGKTVPTYSYKNLGTNINVSGRPVDDSKYNIQVGVQDSQLGAPQTIAGSTVARYLTFRSNNRLTMRDGQTVQYAVATDTITGQVVKLDVTMNVLK
jgi:hypothetical protein